MSVDDVIHRPPQLWFLKPQSGKRLLVGPRQYAQFQDPADLSINPGATLSAGFEPTNLGAINMPPGLAGDQAALFESIVAGVQARDTSGMLALSAVRIHVWANGTIQVAAPHYPDFQNTRLPPSLNSSLLVAARTPILGTALGSEVSSQGGALYPTFFGMLYNTDGAAAHLYRRLMYVAFRIVSNIDFSGFADFM